MYYETKIDSSGKSYIETALTDYALVGSSILNKGMGFSQSERDAFNLHGIIPVSEATLEEQSARSYEAFKSKSSDLDKYLYLRDLQDSNETLFYHLLLNNIEEMMPIVYTPVVGLGCQRFSHIYRRPRGLFLSYPHRDRLDAILANPRFNKVE